MLHFNHTLLNRFCRCGDKMKNMNINDIARLANVSKGTVSRVINCNPKGVSDETRRRIQQIIEETGYIPNRMAGSITIARTKTVGLIIPDIQNMFFPQMVRGVEDCAGEHGCTLFLCNSDSDIHKEQMYLRAFLEKRVDGILINTCGDMLDRNLHKSVCRSEIPIVLLDRKSNDFPDYPGVYIDNRKAAYTGVSYLLEKDCKNVLFFGGPGGLFTSFERLCGYKRALAEAGAEYREEYVFFGTYTADSGYKRIKEAMACCPDADAVFACSDTIAVGVLRGLRELGIDVPGKISVMGFDNITMSADISPALSTVAQPIYDIGYRAAMKLFACIDKEENCRQSEYMDSKLIIRESTRK